METDVDVSDILFSWNLKSDADWDSIFNDFHDLDRPNMCCEMELCLLEWCICGGNWEAYPITNYDILIITRKNLLN